MIIFAMARAFQQMLYAITPFSSKLHFLDLYFRRGVNWPLLIGLPVLDMTLVVLTPLPVIAASIEPLSGRH